MIRTVSNPMNLFYSLNSDDDSVYIMYTEDKGSKPCTVVADIHGVSARGIIDSGADISVCYQFIG